MNKTIEVSEKNCENIQNAHGKVVATMVTGTRFSLGIQ